MEEILKESARQVPAMVILLILCITFAKSGTMMLKAFLAQLTETRQEFMTRSSESRAEFLKIIERFHAEDAQERISTRETIRENSHVTAKQAQTMEDLTKEVKELRTALTPVMRKLIE